MADKVPVTAEQVVAIAISQIGQGEVGGDDMTKYGRDFERNGVDWCSIFVWWCFWTAQGSNPALKKKKDDSVYYPWNAWSDAGIDYYDKHKYGEVLYDINLAYDYVKPGDIIIWARKGYSGSHVGLVVYVSHSRVYTVEGNTSSGVARKDYSRRAPHNGDMFWKCYCRPKYADEYKVSEKLSNFFLYDKVNEQWRGQLAVGDNDDNALYVTGVDNLGNVRKICKVAQTDGNGNPKMLTRRLVQSSRPYQYLLVGQGEVNLPADFNILDQTKDKSLRFEITVDMDYYRPSGYTGDINIVSNTSTVSAEDYLGYRFFIDRYGHPSFQLYNQALDAKEKNPIITWTDCKLRSEEQSLETLTDDQLSYRFGKRYYKLSLYKQHFKNDEDNWLRLTLKVNDTLFQSRVIYTNMRGLFSSSKRKMIIGQTETVNGTTYALTGFQKTIFIEGITTNSAQSNFHAIINNGDPLNDEVYGENL